MALDKAENKENKMNAKDARSMLLSGCQPLIDDILILAIGKKNSEFPENGRLNVNEGARKQVLDIIAPMLQSAGDTQKIEAESTGSIIECLKQGTITFTEAKELMNMLSVQSDIEDVKKLLLAVDRLEATG